MSDPVRLRDDPRVSNALRRDLVRAAQHGVAAPAFDVTAALASFESARANASHGASTAKVARTARWWGIGAIGIAALIVATVLTVHPWQTDSRGRIAPTAPTRPATSPAGSTPTQSTPAQSPPTAPRLDPPTGNAALPASEHPGNVRPSATPRLGSPVGFATRDPIEPGLRSASSSAPPAASSSGDTTNSARQGSGSAHVGAPGGGDDLLARDERMLTDTYALLDVDPSRALALANAGIRAFPDSRHLEDREAIAVRALADLHRSVDARARGARFLARWPSSPQALMVRQAMMR